MVNDHLSDMVSRIRNGYMARNKVVEMPATKMVVGVAEVLKTEGYLADVKEKEKMLIMTLKYAKKTSSIMGIRRISKPGARVYVGEKDLPKVWGGLGINILSTPKGVVSGRQAKTLHVGGELLAQVW